MREFFLNKQEMVWAILLVWLPEHLSSYRQNFQKICTKRQSYKFCSNKALQS